MFALTMSPVWRLRAAVCEPFRRAARTAWMALVVIAAGGSQAAIAEHDGIEMRQQDSRNVFVVGGLSVDEMAALRDVDDLSDSIRVNTIRNGAPSRQPLFGSVELISNDLIFRPRFALRRGVTYRVVTSDALGGMRRDFTLPAEEQAPTAFVADVFPSSDVLPENLLKFYVQFSAPMSRGEVYQRCRVLDEEGDEVEFAFLEIEEELWDATGSRVTLLFDPGRVKRELRPREEIGSPLREGQSFTLEIDQSWRDATGTELIRSHRKRFDVGPHDERCPDPDRWTIAAPRTGTRDALVIRFDEPLDRAMLEHVIFAAEADGSALEGEVSISDNETSWEFTPALEWQGECIRLHIQTNLEDRAGNTIQRPFEVDLTRPFRPKYPDDEIVLLVDFDQASERVSKPSR